MQTVGYLQGWPRIWTRDDWEQIQQVARAGLLLGMRWPMRWPLGQAASSHSGAYTVERYYCSNPNINVLFPLITTLMVTNVNFGCYSDLYVW